MRARDAFAVRRLKAMQPRTAQLSAELLDAAVELMGRSGRGGTVRVRGRSMLPTLVEGQLLAVEFNPERLGVGDMLIFRQSGQLVVHRLLGRSRFPDGRPSLRTRGDGVTGFDPHVHRSQVIARTIALNERGEWRSTRTRRGRLYARMLAWHDLFWSVNSIVAHALQRGLGRIGIRLPLHRWVVAVDRRLLRRAHRLLFHRVHPVIPPPEEAEAAAPGVEP